VALGFIKVGTTQHINIGQQLTYSYIESGNSAGRRLPEDKTVEIGPARKTVCIPAAFPANISESWRRPSKGSQPVNIEPNYA
jgi:YD repeat-containing protein